MSTIVTERDRALLDAVIRVGRDLDLDGVIDRTIAAGRELVGAQYGALGVLGPDRMLREFVTQGIDPEQRAAMGAPPQGHGILGLQIHEARPLRLGDIAAHEMSYGFPPGHPPMRTFLGVPVRTSQGVFGHLYLTEKADGAEFTDEDVDVVTSLAEAAGAAVENAQLHDRGRRRQAWLEALAEIQEVLLTSTDRTSALRLIAARAREVASADFAGILLPAEDDDLAVEVVSGEGLPSEGAAPGVRYPVAGSLTGEVLRSGRPAVVDDLAHEEPAFSHEGHWPAAWPELGPALFVPLSTSTGTLGVLVVASQRDRNVRFPLNEVQLVGSLAGQAALALERLRARDDRARLAVFEDRDRIARDLHDLVIQRLFATGLQLQAGARGLEDAALSERLERAVDDLDVTIEQIRTTIFQLGQRADSLSVEIRGLVEELGRTGITPVLLVEGPIDQGVPERVRPHLLAVLREALTNVARHADASRVDVAVHVGDDIMAVVEDDGVGIKAGGRRSGLRNLRQRAESLGGSLQVSTREGGGTRIAWRVPQRY